MTSIRKVAELAGVSVASVSRTFSDPDVVSEKTREKVEKAAKEAGYRPNMLARNFRTRKSYAIVVLVPDISNPFFSRVITGIQQTAKVRGYSVLLGNTQNSREMEEEYAALVSTCQADGMIQLSASYPFDENEDFGESGPPIVNACECYKSPNTPSVQLDNRAAAEAMTRHLLGLGHQRIGVVQGPIDSPLTEDRVGGYKDAIEAAGIAYDDSLVVGGDFSMESGQKAAGVLMALADRPTAVFCLNDEMAFGVMKRVKRSGLRVPDDISVAGFDDIGFASFSDPMLTTISQPAEEFGSTAVTLLMDVLNGKYSRTPHIILPYELIVRNSTGPVPE